METIFIVGCGSYEDARDIGFFKTADEAEAYCEWRNEHEEWDHYWYHSLKELSLKNEQALYRACVEVTVLGWSDIQYVDSKWVDRQRELVKVCQAYPPEKEADDFEFFLTFYDETVEASEQKAVELLKRAKQVYDETKDLNLAMLAIEGEVVT